MDADARAALQAAAGVFPGPLCDRCLGRFVGRLEPRDKPRDKGRVLRAETGLEAPDAEPDCGWCEGFFTETRGFADKAKAALGEVEFDSFLIATRMHPDVLAKEQAAQQILEQAGATGFEPLKMEFNRAVGAIVFDDLGVGVDLTRPDAIALVDPYFDEVLVTTSSLFLYGRYRKLDRTIPQTRWPCRSCKGSGCDQCENTGQQYLDSVESLVSHVPVAAFAGEESSFHGAGREDIDALMLGTGRPFVLEIKKPRWRRPRDANGEPVALEQLQARINEHAGGRAQVLGLRESEKSEVARVKNGTPSKAYRAHVVAESPVAHNDLLAAVARISGSEIDQRTPQRVAHRRADKVRRRRVQSVELVGFGVHVQSEPGEGTAREAPTPETATRFSLDVHAAAGTYIKELVFGDDGRTQPSFADLLGIPMRVEALDVVAVGDPFASPPPEALPDS